KSTCFVRYLQGNDLLIDNRGSDLYTISLQESTSSTPLCLMAKATPTQAWLCHRRLSHLNFDYINLLSKKDIMIGLPKLKYVKDQLCSSCELSKAKRSSFKSKAVLSSKGMLNLLHMDLCGPIRVASIIGKKYILVIVDDYSRYTGTEFLNTTLNAFFKEEGIEHQTSIARTREQNDIVERQNPDADVPSQQELDLLFGHFTQVFSNLSDGRENGISKWSTEGGGLCCTTGGFVDPDHPEKVYRLRKALYGLKQPLRAWYDELSKFLISKEAEYMALSTRCAQVMWMRTQLQDYGFNYNKILLYCDSQSAIAISCNPVQHSRTKHIHTRYHFIKEQVENGIIKLYFFRTEYQIADMFTKALPEDRFKYLIRRIGMRCLTPAKLEVLAKESA
nr:retrovirus-related Pol polyprotein from transposon TNT 1-94 [Tanacetum cinerariifolium]